MELEARTKIQLLARSSLIVKVVNEKLIEDICKKGYVRLTIYGEIVDVNDGTTLDKNKNHTIEVVVDRLVVKDGIETL